MYKRQVSYLYYADRIYQINLAIAGIAIGTVILPKLSSYIAQKKLKDIDLIQNKSLELSLFLSLPAMAGLLIASEEIVSSLFGYGSFNKEGVENSAKALFYFALGLPAFSLIKILSNFVFARDNTKIPFYFSLISVIINVSISIYYFRDFGFIIIPIATSISSWINALLLYYYLNHKKFFKVSLSLTFQFFKISFSLYHLFLVLTSKCSEDHLHIQRFLCSLQLMESIVAKACVGVQHPSVERDCCAQQYQVERIY